jgi:hypothetical protein
MPPVTPERLNPERLAVEEQTSQLRFAAIVGNDQRSKRYFLVRTGTWTGGAENPRCGTTFITPCVDQTN